jgi:hypothetical protein
MLWAPKTKGESMEKWNTSDWFQAWQELAREQLSASAENIDCSNPPHLCRDLHRGTNVSPNRFDAASLAAAMSQGIAARLRLSHDIHN